MINLKTNLTEEVEKSDQILVSELKNKEEGAFRELVDKYQDKVFNTCLSFVKNQDDADDLSQEVFIEIYSSIGKFREDAKLSTWIYRISVNKSLEHLRRMKRKKRSGLIFWTRKEEPEHDPEVPDFNHPGIVTENREKGALLFEAIQKLPDNQRIAFTLHKLEDLSYEEIAEVMQKSLSSVESLMHRAKTNLRKELYQYYSSG